MTHLILIQVIVITKAIKRTRYIVSNQEFLIYEKDLIVMNQSHILKNIHPIIMQCEYGETCFRKDF